VYVSSDFGVGELLSTPFQREFGVESLDDD
jgi:hypothetical protein